MSALLELAERCEVATGPDRGLDETIWLAAVPGARAFDTVIPGNAKRAGWTIREQRDATGRLVVVPAYTASLDAAKSILLPGIPWKVEDHPVYGISAVADTEQAFAATVELALCAAALRSRASVEQ